MLNLQNISRSFDVANAHSSSGASQQVAVQYICNRDGSVRWIWPIQSKKPLFLKFYNVQGWKAHLFSVCVQLLFISRLSQWVFKTGKLAIDDINKLLANNTNHDWALFTGTVGPNQKYILYQNDVNRKGSFTKIAIGLQSVKLVKNEKQIIQKLANHIETTFTLPKIIEVHGSTLSIQENCHFKSRKNYLTYQHLQCLKQLQNIDATIISYEHFNELHQIEKRIINLSRHRKKLPSGIIKKLHHLFKSLNGSTIQTHLAHVDFTPWNILSDKEGQLYVYDWELSAIGYPKGFDLFHFIIQNSVLTQKKNWKAIKNDINKHASSLLDEKEQDLYLSLYLLVNTLNYLEIYENQEQWHPQIYWLLETWNMALSDVLANTVNARELVILDIFDHLYPSNYAVLKLFDKPEKLSQYSDLDILMKKSNSKTLITMLNKHPLIQRLKIQHGFAMTKMMVLMRSNEILSIDAIHQLKRKALEYMSVSDLIKKPYTNRDGIKNVSLMDTIQFLGLFYGLNNAPIPNKFSSCINALSSDNYPPEALINEQFEIEKTKTTTLTQKVAKMACNRGFFRMKNVLTYVLDTLVGIIAQKGMVITFSGVDGAGKSTIIENLKIEIEKKLRKRVIVIRHRPSLLPILSAWTKGKAASEKHAAETLPRQGTNKNFLSSLLRFAYYYSDYVIGQFYIYVRYVLRGDVVLYDRYYFDFINDSLRSNITLPHWLLKIGYRLLLKPNLNFFLYADASTILSRKKELDAATIQSLTSNYLRLFKELGKSGKEQYMAVENIHMEHTLIFISKKVQAKLF